MLEGKYRQVESLVMRCPVHDHLPTLHRVMRKNGRVFLYIRGF